MKRYFLIFVLFIFSLSFSFSKEYGLVLSGGGGKGAYEVGVWKALGEYGIAQKTTSISGASVGGLNAVLFACENISTIEDIWLNMVPEKITNNDTEFISQNGLIEIMDTINMEKVSSRLFLPFMLMLLRKVFFMNCVILM